MGKESPLGFHTPIIGGQNGRVYNENYKVELVDRLVVLQFSSNLVPQHLGCFEAWMDRILVYWLGAMLVGPCPCTHKICDMACNISMTCGSSWYNIYQPEDSLVVLQVSPNLVLQQLGCSKAWNDNIPVHWLCPRLVRPCPCTHKTCGMGGSTPTACGSSCVNMHQLITDGTQGRLCPCFSHNMIRSRVNMCHGID